MNNKYLNDYYSTSDLALASLISLYCPLESIDKTQNPNKVQFLFKNDRALEILIDSYWRGELKVEPKSYFNQIKFIKSRIYGS